MEADMKCDKCGSELEGVWVGPGDIVQLFRDRDSMRYMVLWENSIGKLTVERLDTKAIYQLNYTDGIYSSPDGRPVLGYRDPRDERIKGLEAELAEARKDTGLNIFLTADELRQE